MNDCVVAVLAGANAPKREVLRELRVKVKVEDKSPIQVPRKRKHKWNTWHDKGFAIYMLLHPKIFDGDSALASIYLGIAQSTLLGIFLPVLIQALASYDTMAFVFCIYLGFAILPNTFFLSFSYLHYLKSFEIP